VESLTEWLTQCKVHGTALVISWTPENALEEYWSCLSTRLNTPAYEDRHAMYNGLMGQIERALDERRRTA
jgi:SNF2 family DNA or RNA helicase